MNRNWLVRHWKWGVVVLLCVLFVAAGFAYASFTKKSNSSIMPASTSSALVIAQGHIGNDFALLTNKTQEYPFGWVFYYTTKKYLQTGDPKDTIPGAAPFIVNRDGTVVDLTSAQSSDVAINAYLQEWIAGTKNTSESDSATSTPAGAGCKESSNSTSTDLDCLDWPNNYYTYAEYASPDENMVYDLYTEDSPYPEKGELVVNGFQTAFDVFVKFDHTKDSSIDVIFDGYNVHENYNVSRPFKQGDVLFSITPTPKGYAVTWGKLQPMLTSKDLGSAVFEPNHRPYDAIYESAINKSEMIEATSTDRFIGKWSWSSEYNSQNERTLDLTLRQATSSNEVVGSYCATEQGGNRIDCWDDLLPVDVETDIISIEGTLDKGTLKLSFMDAYGGGFGKASLTLLRDGRAEWVITTLPQGEYWLPGEAILTKETP